MCEDTSGCVPGCDANHYAGPVEMFDERAEIERLRDRLYEVEHRVAWLMKQAGREEQVLPLDEAVRQSLDAGGFIEAVMTYRRRTGAGLAEAQQYVDRLRRRVGTVNDDEAVDVPHSDLAAAESTDVPGATEAGAVDEA